MSTEDLLLPRYKLLADYPLNIIEIGAVFDKCTEFQCVFFDKYPHLFRKIFWWEERKIEDMPAFVKRIKFRELISWHNIEIEEVIKVEQWVNENEIGKCFFTDMGGEIRQLNFDTDCFLPATLTEYNEYISNPQQHESR